MREKIEFYGKYQALSSAEKRILQISAALYRTERKTDFTNCITKSSVRTDDDKKFYASELNSVLAKLREKDLVDSKQNCLPKVVHFVSEIALDPKNSDVLDNIESIKALVPMTYTYGVDANKNNTAYLKGLKWNPAAYNYSNLRFLHVAVHQNDEVFFNSTGLHTIGHCFCVFHDLLHLFYYAPLDMAWVQTRTPIIQIFLACVKLHFMCSDCRSFSPDEEQWVKFYLGKLPIIKPEALPVFIENQLQQINIHIGFLKQIKIRGDHLPKDSYCKESISGMIAFFEGKDAAAISAYESSIRFYRRLFTKNEWFRNNMHAVFYVLALIRKTDFANALNQINLVEKACVEYSALPFILKMILNIKKGDLTAAKELVGHANWNLKNLPTTLFFTLALYDWAKLLMDSDNLTGNREVLKSKYSKAKEKQCALSAHLYAEMIVSDGEEDIECDAFLESSPYGGFRFLEVVLVKSAWEYQIEQLHTLIVPKIEKKQEVETVVQDKRLAWFISLKSQSITALEQKIDRYGKWTSGKPVAMKRLYEKDDALAYLTSKDRIALLGLRMQISGWYNEKTFAFDARYTLNALVGHPCVFHIDNSSLLIELIKGHLELIIEKRPTNYFISLSHHSVTPHVFLEKEGLNRYRVIDFGEDAVAIGAILTKKGLAVPLAGKDKIVDIVRNGKTSIKIQTDIEEDNIPTVQGNANCVVQVLPTHAGLKVSLRVKPLENDSFYFKPGVGNKSILSENVQPECCEKQKAIRDFSLEKKNAACLVQTCQTLADWDTKTYDWEIDSLEASLIFLQELKEYQKDNVLSIEWPKGETLKVKEAVSFNQFSLSIKSKNNWFEYEGDVAIDQDVSLDLKHLLDLLDTSYGSFIELSKGEFIQLADSFKRQLEKLKAVSDGNQIYHLNADILRTLAQEAHETKVDKEWRAHVDKVKAMEKHTPLIPSTLQAELRDYQRVGFSYLSRLAHWGIGACLADDMGLGKTVQTIALLLEQAIHGPCLIVAPTSVCLIWQEELLKFAPSLNVFSLSDVSDRQECVRSLGKMDVLITSYGLLHQSGDVLSEKDWNVVVLDEAQAIKNASTKRWQYATQLKGRCRVALTGTPIENHLGEIWSIFHFLNPGLLGTQTSFQNKFLLPIEKTGSAVLKRTLKNLVSPYILRRTKSEVLQDLPPKIEQSILIESTLEEKAFYEAIRQRAIDKIQSIDETANINKRFAVLAEITRLRQACCHSSLVDEMIQLESSKINVFLKTIKKLKENHHKVLVFSQYVRYLEKIRSTLEKEEISYQYLDGSTPSKARQKAIDAFQAGEGDVFLISLKAGGTGLNLTAADYVIILDPWWNPAVEDQAAARAHRMGQKRPVTIYRLIMKNTIEEKIVKLHANKRELADDLLSGGDASGRITEEELIELITS